MPHMPEGAELAVIDVHSLVTVALNINGVLPREYVFAVLLLTDAPPDPLIFNPGGRNPCRQFTGRWTERRLLSFFDQQRYSVAIDFHPFYSPFLPQ